jgi:subfamily B ATP-binding cassette protein MsbA
MESVRKLSNVNNRVQVMLAAAERIFELRDEVPTVTEKPGATALPPLREAVRFEGVHFRYTAEEPVLRGVDLEVRRGERIAFVGASGVGKTTLVSLVPRFYDPTAGRVTVDGLDLREVTLRSLRDQIGLVTQEVFLFDDSVRANIAYGKPGATDAEIEAAARKAYADGFVRDLPRGYDTVVGEDAVILSGGQRQRLALARAILKDPAIFILDEATSQLDSESERAIQQALEAFTRDRTTFIIAHRLSTVEHADRIVVMEAGRIADVGTHAELLTRSPLYRNLHQLQFAG